MRFDWPIGLLGLVLVPLVVIGYAWIDRRRAPYSIRYTNIEVLAGVASGRSRWRSYVPGVLLLLALTAALVALARPEARESVSSQQASIALVVDFSGSMAATDVKPTRLGAAEGAIQRFLAGLPKQYRVGLVIFGSEPYVAAPLTHDRSLVLQALRFGNPPGQGTAIGDALARAVELLEPLPAGGTSLPSPGTAAAPANKPLSAILMLSDGAQTSGLLPALQGAARAKSFGIPVDTVALGTPGGTLNIRGFSRPVPPDPTLLRAIATTTGGEFFATQSQSRLNAVYERLASRLGRTREWRELSFLLVGVAALLALVAGVLSMRWSERLP
ncbi:MAG: VWA domain-containing protein [Gaiellales bacterium]